MAHVTFIHGIANKPAPDVLLKNWRQALAHDDGLALGTKGISSTMVYWADVLYEKPDKDQASQESLEAAATNRSLAPPVSTEWKEDLSGKEKRWVQKFNAKLKLEELDNPELSLSEAAAGRDLERILLPWWIKRPMMEVFLRDVHHYLFNVEFSPRAGTKYRVQDEIRGRMLKALKEGSEKPGPHILVSHSMGTVIAYDCLKRVPNCPKIDALMTIGSPLGLDEIQEKMSPEWSRNEGFPSDRLQGGWVNVYDKLDPVAGLDPNISNDYQCQSKAVIEDLHEPNYGPWRHDINKYLGGLELRKRLKVMLGLQAQGLRTSS
jgi:hypothetical protein